MFMWIACTQTRPLFCALAQVTGERKWFDEAAA